MGVRINGKFEFNASSQQDHLIHKRLIHNLVLGLVGEFSRSICVIALLYFASTFSNTTLVLSVLHP